MQRALKEERGKREAAERALETQGEVAISMEDVQPFASLPGTASGENGPATLGVCVCACMVCVCQINPWYMCVCMCVCACVCVYNYVLTFLSF